MAVVIDAVGTEKHTAPNTSASYTGITVGSGSNKALVVVIVWGSSSSSVSPTSRSVIWDSGGTNQTMTEIIFSTGGTPGVHVGIFGLVAPSTGNKTLAASWTTSVESFIGAISFTGVDQTGGATSFPNATGANTTTTIAIASATGDYVVGGFGSGASLGTPSGTVIFSDSASGTFINACEEYYSGSASVTFGSTASLATIAATDIKAAGGVAFQPAWARHRNIVEGGRAN